MRGAVQLHRRAPKLLLALAGGAVLASAAHSEPARWGTLLRAAGIGDERVIRAMDKVRRAEFLPPAQRDHEWADEPLPIGYGQTTSQPSLVALMLQELRLRPGCNALEVGAGSGYVLALLGEICARAAGVEIVEPLARGASERLEKLGYAQVSVRAGDGYLGWPERAPFDAILVSAGAAKIPAPLIAQLAPGGRMVIPVGSGADQFLQIFAKAADGTFRVERSVPVRFVPLTGSHAESDRKRQSLGCSAL